MARLGSGGLGPLADPSARHVAVWLGDVRLDVPVASSVELLLLHQRRGGITVRGLAVRVDRDGALVPFLGVHPIAFGCITIAAAERPRIDRRIEFQCLLVLLDSIVVFRLSEEGLGLNHQLFCILVLRISRLARRCGRFAGQNVDQRVVLGALIAKFFGFEKPFQGLRRKLFGLLGVTDLLRLAEETHTIGKLYLRRILGCLCKYLHVRESLSVALLLIKRQGLYKDLFCSVIGALGLA